MIDQDQDQDQDPDPVSVSVDEIPYRVEDHLIPLVPEPRPLSLTEEVVKIKIKIATSETTSKDALSSSGHAERLAMDHLTAS